MSLKKQRTPPRFLQLLALALIGLCAITAQASAAGHSSAATLPSLADGQSASNVYKLEGANIQFEIPEGWEAKKTDKGNVAVSPKGGGISVVFTVIPQSDFKFENLVEGVMEGVKGLGGEIKSDDEAKEDTHNGMAHTSQSFSGQVKGSATQWSVDMLKANKPVLVLTTVLSPKVMEARVGEYAKLVMSIKKVS